MASWDFGLKVLTGACVNGKVFSMVHFYERDPKNDKFFLIEIENYSGTLDNIYVMDAYGFSMQDRSTWYMCDLMADDEIHDAIIGRVKHAMASGHPPLPLMFHDPSLTFERAADYMRAKIASESVFSTNKLWGILRASLG